MLALRTRLSIAAAAALVWLPPPAALAAETPLILAGSDWRYLDTGVAPSPDWAEPDHDDGAWLVGPAPLGYGLFDIATPVAYGVDPADRHVTTWFRQAFDVVDPVAFDAVSVHLRRDDGAVVYLNGVEVLRDNLPAGPIGPETLAIAAQFGEDQDRFVDAVVPQGLLVAGENVVAVEVHQQSALSSDLVLDLRLSGWDGPTAVTRGPYLQQPTPEGVLVRWRTDGPSAGRLWSSPKPGGPLAPHVDDPVVAFDHELWLAGAPGSLVGYGVGTPSGLVLAGGDSDHVLRLPPAPGSDLPLRIWVLGDSGTANADAEAVRDAYDAYAPARLETDVWLMLGDNAYNDGTLAEYQAAVFDFYPEWLRQVPLWPVLGNHEAYTSRSADQSGPYFDLFTLPTAGECGGVPSGTEAYYSFDHGPVHFVVLDSADSDRSSGGAMATWAKADLAAVDQATWVIVAFHHPPYSKGSHNSDTESYMVQMRENLLPVLEAGGVDLVLTGHSHSYERSFLLDGHYGPSTTLDPAMVRQDHDGDPLGDGPYTKWPEGQAPHEGAVYVVAGSSGQVSGGTFDHPAMFASLAALGSLVLDIDGLTLEGRFLDDVGAVLDTFAIDKGRTTIVSVSGARIAATGEAITLTGLAREPGGGEVPTYSWDWGDGSPGSLGNPASHAWTAEGPFTVTLTVTDSRGDVTSETLRVDVDDHPPVIDVLEVSADPVEGSLATLTGHAVDAGGDPLTYQWTVDGVPHDGDIVDHLFFEDGVYAAILTVTDDAGRVVTGALDVDVANLPPSVASIIVPADATEAVPFVLTASVSDPGSFYDPLTWSWRLPDGAVIEGTAPTVTLEDDGPWPVVLTVTDDEGAVTVHEADVTVANLPPTVQDATWWGVPEEGALVGLRAEGLDPSPRDVVALSWSFDGGATWIPGGEIGHVFGDQGPHEVLVRATDDDGGASETSIEVALANVPPEILALRIPDVVDEGVPAALGVDAADPGFDDALTVRWAFDHGEARDGAEILVALPDDGEYGGVVEVVDDEGAGTSMPFGVRARNVAPAFVTAAPDGRVAPGSSFSYRPEVRDVDPVSLRLVGPEGAHIDRDGTVRWRAPAAAGAEVRFALNADDGDGGDTTQSWTLSVAEDAAPDTRLRRDDAVPACGCAGGSHALEPWWLVLFAPLLRRRISR
jgi:hypothetical protein